jgi:tetratricopeptide (TPR) repeat protein
MDYDELLETARMLSISGQYEEAIPLLEDYLSVFPNDVSALKLMGNVIELQILDKERETEGRFAQSPQYIKALNLYEKALALAPHDIELHIDIADYWANVGEFALALSYVDRVILLEKDGAAGQVTRRQLEAIFEKRREIVACLAEKD